MPEPVLNDRRRVLAGDFHRRTGRGRSTSTPSSSSSPPRSLLTSG